MPASVPGRWWLRVVAADGTGGEASATGTLNRLTALTGAAMRLGLGLAAVGAALLGAHEPGVAGPAVVGAVTVTGIWLAVFAWVVWRRGLWWPVVVGDLMWTTTLCLGQGLLVGPEASAPGTGWVAVTVTASIVVANAAWRATAAVPAGLVPVAGYLVGAVLADRLGAGLVQAAMFVVQVAAAAVLMWLVRRAGRTADAALAGYYRAQRAATVEQVSRAVEREENLRLHDTVLATLTMVGTGSVDATSRSLRRQARADLTVLTDTRPAAPDTDREVRLGELVRTVVSGTALAVELRTAPVVVPAPVGEAMAAACGQALVNVAHHAGTGRAEVSVGRAGERVTVSITDAGVGFDTGRVRPHRWGVSEGIVSRMRLVGGDAEIESRPGAGTTVRLWWPR